MAEKPENLDSDVGADNEKLISEKKAEDSDVEKSTASEVMIPTVLPGPKTDFRLDAKWALILVVIIVSVVMTVILNSRHENSGTTQLVSTIDVDNGDTKINWNRYTEVRVTLGETYTISQSGIYHFTGTLEDGAIIVDAGVEAEVKLILDNVSIHNNTGPAIACLAGNDLVIELVGENVLEDGITYTGYDEDVTGVIYSKADLTLTGEGELTLTANYQDGIVGKDDVKFGAGTYKINAVDDGIRGKDSVYITGGSFAITAGADGIKSTNETDAGKGFVLIEDGNFNITAGAKGIKAINSVIVQGGMYVLATTDDALHSDNYIGITGGTINISSGDDGVHANRELIIDDGEITIVKSYEGLEAQVVTINGGEINLKASDDGINAGGGTDNSATNRVGASPFDADENCVISINGGSVYVNASGDGIDSNGWLYINGGSVVIDGPTDNGNGALDAGMGIVMNGGEAIAVGASGMAESLGATSSINNVSIYLTTAQTAGTEIKILSADGETVVEHKAAKSFSHIAVGTSKFKLGETYVLYLNGEKYTNFTISGITTMVGNTNRNPGQMPGQGQAPEQSTGQGQDARMGPGQR